MSDLERRLQERIKDLKEEYDRLEPVSGLERDYMMKLRRDRMLLEDCLRFLHRLETLDV